MVEVNIINVNDNPPEFEERDYALSIAENQPGGALVGRLQATDIDGDTVTYSVLQGGKGSSESWKLRS